MSTKDLIALMPGPPPPDLPQGLTIVQARGWTAFLARPAFGLLRRRKALLRLAQKRQIWLEELLRAGTVLPALPGTRIAPDAVEPMVACNTDLLTSLATRLSGRAQYQIILRCDLDQAARILAPQPGPFHGYRAPNSLQAALSDHLLTRLRALDGAEVIALPVAGDVVANCTLLLPRTGVFALDHALEEIDALWSAGFTLRQVGPSPAVSFASLGLKPVPRAVLTAAAASLGLGPEPAKDAIRAARNEALKQPGALPERIREAARLLTMSRALPTPGPFHSAYVWAEGQAAPVSEQQAEAA